jgi:uncharacterized membrane protein YoaK (UPF0700 family)
MGPSGPPNERADRALHRHVTALLLLTAATGVIDAVSYLSLDRVFTGNMTGNVLFIGFALVGVNGIPLVNNLVALLGFAAGAIVAARFVGRGHPTRVPARSLATLGVNTGLTVVVAVVWMAVGTLGTTLMVVLTALLAAAMGAQVAAVRPIGNADITTVVVTSTLANLSRDSRLAGAPAGGGPRWGRAHGLRCAGPRGRCRAHAGRHGGAVAQHAGGAEHRLTPLRNRPTPRRCRSPVGAGRRSAPPPPPRPPAARRPVPAGTARR